MGGYRRCYVRYREVDEDKAWCRDLVVVVVVFELPSTGASLHAGTARAPAAKVRVAITAFILIDLVWLRWWDYRFVVCICCWKEWTVDERALVFNE